MKKATESQRRNSNKPAISQVQTGAGKAGVPLPDRGNADGSACPLVKFGAVPVDEIQGGLSNPQLRARFAASSAGRKRRLARRLQRLAAELEASADAMEASQTARN